MELVFAPFALIFVFLIIAGPFIFILILVKMIMGRSKGNGKRLTAEETRAIQEIHRGLERMEKRIEALETILFDRGKSAESTQEALDREEL